MDAYYICAYDLYPKVGEYGLFVATHTYEQAYEIGCFIFKYPNVNVNLVTASPYSNIKQFLQQCDTIGYVDNTKDFAINCLRNDNRKRFSFVPFKTRAEKIALLLP